MSSPTPQDVAFVQGGQTVYTFDSSILAVSVPKRAADFRSWSFHLWDALSDDGANPAIKGTLQAWVSDAPIAKDLIVGKPRFVPVPELLLDIGGAAALPAMLRDLFNDVGWVSVRWTPGSGSQGTLGAWFDGVRR